MMLNKSDFVIGALLLGLLAACAPKLPEPAIFVPETEGEAPTQTATVPTITATPSPSADDFVQSGRDAASRGDWEAAIGQFEQALALTPEDGRIYVARGKAYLAQGARQAAIADFDQAIELDENDSIAYYSRALTYFDGQDYGQALRDFNLAIEHAASFALAYRNRAEVHIIEGRYEAAVLDLQVYLSLTPNALDSAEVQARILALQGEAQQEVVNEAGLLFFDDFENPDNGWFSNGDAALVAEYEEGGYRLMHPQANAAGWALPGRLFTDVRIEASAEKLGGDDDNFFGLMCRVQGTTASANFYILMISSDGYYGIGKRVGGGNLVLIGADKMQASNAINTGEASNQIRAECDEDRLALYVNGELIAEEYDEELDTGQIGLMVGTFDQGGTDVRFDDLAVYAIEVGEE